MPKGNGNGNSPELSRTERPTTPGEKQHQRMQANRLASDPAFNLAVASVKKQLQEAWWAEQDPTAREQLHAKAVVLSLVVGQIIAMTAEADNLPEEEQHAEIVAQQEQRAAYGLY